MSENLQPVLARECESTLRPMVGRVRKRLQQPIPLLHTDPAPARERSRQKGFVRCREELLVRLADDRNAVCEPRQRVGEIERRTAPTPRPGRVRVPR